MKKVAQRHQMVSGSLALLYFLLGFHGGRQGSGPDRGRSPVEWGDFPSVRTFVCLFVHPPLWAIQPGLRPSQPGLRPSQPGLRPRQPALRWRDRWANSRMPNFLILQDFVPYRGRCPASHSCRLLNT